MIPIVFLRSVELFQDLTDEELAQIQPFCEEVSFAKETNVFKEGDRANFLFTLVEGAVSLRYRLPSRDSGEESRVAAISQGQTFGWSGIHQSGKYTLTAYCAEESCTALRIEAAKLQKVLDSNHTIGYKVMRRMAEVIGDRFIALQNQVAKVLGQDAIDGW